MAVGVTPILDWARVNARIDYGSVREVISEFLGTFVLCLFAVGGTCNLVALVGVVGGVGNISTVTIIPYAFGYFVATLLFGGVSGAHINPAVSVGLAIAGKLSWIKLHAFLLVQFLGGYLGSLLAYALYKSYYFRLTGGVTDVPASSAMFVANQGVIPIAAGFANEIVITAIFMMCVMALKDNRPMTTPNSAQALLIFFTVLGLGLTFGQTTGAVLNPARDLCSRLAALSYDVPSDFAMRGLLQQQWWSVGLFAPFIGAMVGSLIYIFLIGSQLQTPEMYGEMEGGPGAGQGGWKDTVFVPLGPQGQQVPHARSPPPMSHYQQQQNGQAGRGVQFHQ